MSRLCARFMPGLYALQSGQIHVRDGAINLPLKTSKRKREIVPLLFSKIFHNFFYSLELCASLRLGLRSL